MTRAEVYYHGTSIEIAQQIEDTQVFLGNPNPGRWLGRGTYFFDDHERALEWAIQLHPGHAAVLRTKIRPQNCLDLTRVSGARALRRGFEKMELKYARENRTIPDNVGTSHQRDWEVIEWVCSDVLRKFDSVKAFFPEGEPVFPGSALTMRSNVQIVVRDGDIIVGPTEEFTQVVAEVKPHG